MKVHVWYLVDFSLGILEKYIKYHVYIDRRLINEKQKIAEYLFGFKKETKQTRIDRWFIGLEFNSLPMVFDDKREKC